MDKKIVTKGLCYRCDQVVAKAGAKSHIKKCYDIGEAQIARGQACNSAIARIAELQA